MDVRLLTALAETGRAAVHEIAGRLGMDVREVASRLAALSTTGLPIVVGVECDQQAVRNAIAAAHAWNNQVGGPHQPHGAPGGYPQPGAYPAQGPAGTGYPAPYPSSTPLPAPGGPSGPQPSQTGPSGPQPFATPGPPPPSPGTAGHQPPGWQPPPPGHAAAGFPPAAGPQDPMHTWGPPGSASWARGDQYRQPDSAPQPTGQPTGQPTPRTGTIGSKLDVDGPEGEQVTIQLVEVVDPADFLFSAAGYQLQEGERAVVVHTELTNRGPMQFTSLPDLYLVLVTKDDSTVSKSPVSLSSRPPHRIGVPPGETAGGHTVYVLPDSLELSAVRWTPRPGDKHRTLVWDITDI